VILKANKDQFNQSDYFHMLKRNPLHPTSPQESDPRANKMAQWHNSRLVFRRPFVQISGRTLAALTGLLWVSSVPPVNATGVPQLNHDSFLPTDIIQSRYWQCCNINRNWYRCQNLKFHIILPSSCWWYEAPDEHCYNKLFQFIKRKPKQVRCTFGSFKCYLNQSLKNSQT
jgi:hypothetical protein